ncbi:flagellar assembly lytic transglycosylase [Spirochaeta lutea]|uniref:Transglycosylase SLT domain-containing protein n=1 Tax=Spirochaeta lutea TaxID=1480694 RepID=A0A098R0A6_9SPIO|nr:lytic transglycosylase domain-containing protein [Spirochaeta lutea]KGE73344.1 hypothetical protein DC28_04250 [Spirochaeta lutea]
MIRILLLLFSLLVSLFSCSTGSIFGVDSDRILSLIREEDSIGLLEVLLQAEETGSFRAGDILRISPGAGFESAEMIAALPGEEIVDRGYDISAAGTVVEQLYRTELSAGPGQVWYWRSMERLLRGFLAEGRYEDILETAPALNLSDSETLDTGVILLFPWYTAHRLEALIAQDRSVAAFEEITRVMATMKSLGLPREAVHDSYWYYWARLAAMVSQDYEELTQAIGGYVTRVSPRNGHGDVLGLLLARIRGQEHHPETRALLAFLGDWAPLLVWKIQGLSPGTRQGIEQRITALPEDVKARILSRQDMDPEVVITHGDRQIFAEFLLRSDDQVPVAGFGTTMAQRSRGFESLAEISGLDAQQVALLLEFAGRAAYNDRRYENAQRVFLRGFEGLPNRTGLTAQRLLWWALRSLLQQGRSDTHAGVVRMLGHVHDPEYFEDLLEPYVAASIEQSDWNNLFLLLKDSWDHLSWLVRGQLSLALQAGVAEGSVPGFTEGDERVISDRIRQIQGNSRSIYYRILTNRAGLQDGALGRSELTAWYRDSLQAGGEAGSDESGLGEFRSDVPGIEERLAHQVFSSEALKSFLENNLTLNRVLRGTEYGSSVVPRWPAEVGRVSGGLELLREVSEWLLDRGRYPAAIRVSQEGLKAAEPGSVLETEFLMAVFPRAYREIVSEIVGTTGLESLFWGLIRSESLFDAAATSWVGAMGLGQLMPATAREMAGRMGLEFGDIDLNDPETNMRISFFYLQYLARRLPGWIPVLTGYNAGYGRARDWYAAWEISRGPLWAERVPFQETRGYIRRIITATFYYELQYQEDPDRNFLEQLFDLGTVYGEM